MITPIAPRTFAPARPSAPIAISPRLVAVASALPDVEVGQGDVVRFAARWLDGALGPDAARLMRVFAHSGVETRRVCMPLDWYETDHAFAETNALYIEHALELSARATRAALACAGLAPADVDHVIVVTSTGIAAPSLDARLVNRLGLRDDVRRTPVWGLGCAGGAAGLALARDLALARPAARILLVAVELCSFAFQRGDRDRKTLIAASLFADGAAAAIVAGPDAALPDAPGSDGPDGGGATTRLALVDSASVTWKDTLDVMGWDVDGRGLHVVISRDIPEIVRRRVRPAVDTLLARHGLALEDIGHVVAHPGGPKVLDALGHALGAPAAALADAHAILRTCGNMSSPTCLFVLERAARAGAFRPGDWGVVLALGPGFSAEQVLVRAL